MFRLDRWPPLAVAAILCSGNVVADAQSTTMRSLDEQVQQIKSDVLDISSELTLLEEQLLFPSNTQLAVFVAFDMPSQVRLDALHLNIDGESATRHIYTFKELEALQSGGVQRLYTGNITRGAHKLGVSVIGKKADGEDFVYSEQFTFSKSVEPQMLGLSLAGAAGDSISLTDW